jgi:hypothetical protein
MLDVTVAGWAATIGVIVALFALDLFVSRPGDAHVIEFKEALRALSSSSAPRSPSAWRSG